jgi:hypothetical protein
MKTESRNRGGRFVATPDDWRYDVPQNKKTLMTRDTIKIIVAFFIGLLIGRCALGASPASELHAAVVDCAKLPAELQHGVQYLSVHNSKDKATREETMAVASYAVNALSRVRFIKRVEPITPTLIRFNICDYTSTDAERKEWYAALEKLGENEPFWHLKTEVAEQVGKPVAGTPLAKPKTKTVTVDGGWVGIENAAALYRMTGRHAAIMRADWFVFNALDGDTYYDFIGASKSQTQLFKDVGIDIKKIGELRSFNTANLRKSDVTHKPRRIEDFPTPWGHLYRTSDVNRVNAARDFVGIPVDNGGAKVAFDAAEIFYTGPNSLFRVAVYVGDERRSEVDPNVATDDSDPLADNHTVKISVSCFRCHQESALRPFVDSQTETLLADKINANDPKILLQIKELYRDGNFQRDLEFDRKNFDIACHDACGLTGKEMSAALGSTVREYAYSSITLERAAREIGCSPEVMKIALGKSNNHNALAIRRGNKDVVVDLWNLAFPEVAMLAGKTEPDDDLLSKVGEK